MPSPPPLPAVLDFMQILWRVVHGVEQMSKRMSARSGITGPQRLVLRLIGLRPGISASELAAMLHLHRGTVTGLLQRLQASGLLMRKTDAGDRRRAVLTLTARGRRANELRAGTAEEAVAAALRAMTAHYRACARRALSAIADRVGSDD
jgi:DNA-binding MarR family transcriptional regulator